MKLTCCVFALLALVALASGAPSSDYSTSFMTNTEEKQIESHFTGFMLKLTHKVKKLMAPFVIAKKMSNFTVVDLRDYCHGACFHLRPADCPERERTQWSTPSPCRDCIFSCFTCKSLDVKLAFDVPRLAFSDDDEVLASMPNNVDEMPIDEIINHLNEKKGEMCEEEEKALRGAFNVDRTLGLKCFDFKRYKEEEKKTNAVTFIPVEVVSDYSS